MGSSLRYWEKFDWFFTDFPVWFDTLNETFLILEEKQFLIQLLFFSFAASLIQVDYFKVKAIYFINCCQDKEVKLTFL